MFCSDRDFLYIIGAVLAGGIKYYTNDKKT